VTRVTHRGGLRRLPAAIALAALMVWAPLAFASFPPWAESVLHIVAFLLLAVAAVAAADLRGLRAAAVPAAAIAAVAVLGALQSLSWPEGIVRALSPHHAALAAGAGAPAGSAVPLSLAPAASARAALNWAAAAALLLAAALAGQTRAGRRWIAAGLGASALFQVLYGAEGLAARRSTIWGVEAGGAAERLRGTYVNPDHLALLLGMTLPVLLAWGWWALRRAREDAALERRVLLVAPPAVAWLTVFVGLAFTGSRGGLIAAAGAATLQAALLALRGRRARLGAIGFAVFAIGLATVAAVGLQQGLGRWLATSRYELTWNDRIGMARQTLALWGRFPLLGAGLGAYREAAPLLMPVELAKAGWLRHAHNDLLELPAVAGAVGFVAMIAGVAGLGAGLVRRFRGAVRSEDRCAALAALGALAAVAVHSAFDFGITMPANAAVFAVVCGAALGMPPSLPARQGGKGAEETSGRGPGSGVDEPTAQEA
jgi:O-antigen ligase